MFSTFTAVERSGDSRSGRWSSMTRFWAIRLRRHCRRRSVYRTRLHAWQTWMGTGYDIVRLTASAPFLAMDYWPNMGGGQLRGSPPHR